MKPGTETPGPVQKGIHAKGVEYFAKYDAARPLEYSFISDIEPPGMPRIQRGWV
jgi:hypothetical protein